MLKQLIIAVRKKLPITIFAFFCIPLIVLSAAYGSQSAEAYNPSFNETALFLAGKDLPEKSELNKYNQTKFYQNYKKQLEISWNNRQDINIKKINGWREKYLFKEYTDTIYYPFAGPDILNAVVFFPKGSEYLMFGLEAPGDIPEPQKMTEEKIRSGMAGLKKAINTALRINFFKTKEMQKEISTNSFNSIKAVMMFFLGRLNYEVLEVKKIWLDDNANVIDKPDKTSKILIPGSKIVFRKSKGHPVKKIFYFMIDVSDLSLKNHQNYISYLNSKKDFTTIIKAASYLMHKDKEFSVIRGLTLKKSVFLLQEDSGIPFRFFSPNDWQLSLYGEYNKPISLFVSRFQPDFKKAMEKYSKGHLPFIFGYNFSRQEYNLMFAERIKK